MNPDKACTILGEKVREELAHAGRQALYSAACLLAFIDTDLAGDEAAVLKSLKTFLDHGTPMPVTSRRQTHAQILATFESSGLKLESGIAIVQCLAYVAYADGVVKPEEKKLLVEIARALGLDAAACEKILEKVRTEAR